MAAPVANHAFAPSPRARPAGGGFEGLLEVAGGRLATACAALDGDFAMGGSPRRFPSLALAFTSCEGELLPLWRGLHRRPDRASYWDVMAGPGRIWSEPGDGARNRAAFPFQLSNERENDSHHGVTHVFDAMHGHAQAVGDIKQDAEAQHAPADDFGISPQVGKIEIDHHGARADDRNRGDDQIGREPGIER